MCVFVEMILQGDVIGSQQQQPLSLRGHVWRATSDFETLEPHCGDISKEVNWLFKKGCQNFQVGFSWTHKINASFFKLVAFA